MVTFERQVVLQILTPCTLNCKLCADFTPTYKKLNRHHTETVDTITKELEKLFEIYDHIQDLTITGGEPLLHKDLAEILEQALKYSSQYDSCRIFSNGSLMPDEATIALLKANKDKLLLTIDFYGSDKSVHFEDIKARFEREDIPLRKINYCGDKPDYGGWIDLGPINVRQNKTEKEIIDQVFNCHCANYKDAIVFKGCLTRCSTAIFGLDLGYFELKPEEYINLLDDTNSLDYKRELVMSWGAETVLTACYYCNGFDIKNSPRYTPAVQLED